jgi:hypothetical protein
MKKIYLVTLIGSISALMTLAFTKGGFPAEMAMGPSESGAMIEKSVEKTVPYETGGVGIEERAAMKQNMSKYNLRLIFATSKGQYLASIPVEIKDQQGKMVFRMETKGPWLFLNLPAGQYDITALYENKELNWRTRIEKGPETVILTWKQ